MNEVMQELIEGNKRYVGGNFTHPNQSLSRRQELAKGQSPQVAVLAWT